MEEKINQQQAMEYLNQLNSKPLAYGTKFHNWDLYDIGFGNCVNVPCELRPGTFKNVAEFTLHILCRFKIINRGTIRSVKRYYEDTPSEEFGHDIQHLIGKKIKRVGLSDKNDLWLDLDDYWIVFATFETGEESWRFMPRDRQHPHLVAADTWLELNYWPESN